MDVFAVLWLGSVGRRNLRWKGLSSLEEESQDWVVLAESYIPTAHWRGVHLRPGPAAQTALLCG